MHQLLLELREQPVTDLGDTGEVAGRSSRSASILSSSTCLVISFTRSRTSFSFAQRPASSSRRAFASQAPSRAARASPEAPSPSRRGSISSCVTRARPRRARRATSRSPSAAGRRPRRRGRSPCRAGSGQDVAIGEHRGPRRAPRRGSGRRGAPRSAPSARAGSDRVGDRQLADEDGLEAPLERRVLLDVRAVLVEGRRAHGAQLSARASASRFPAKTAPSAAPAPTIVWSSSMKG